MRTHAYTCTDMDTKLLYGLVSAPWKLNWQEFSNVSSRPKVLDRMTIELTFEKLHLWGGLVCARCFLLSSHAAKYPQKQHLIWYCSVFVYVCECVCVCACVYESEGVCVNVCACVRARESESQKEQAHARGWERVRTRACKRARGSLEKRESELKREKANKEIQNKWLGRNSTRERKMRMER